MPPEEKVRELLQGFPEATIAACLGFRQTGSVQDLDRAVAGIIQHHLRTPPKEPVASMPDSEPLLTGLGLDSLTIVEMVFLFEDLFAAELPHEEYSKLVTLGELRALLRAKTGAVAA
ncbi:MAG TPA: acyl carrier protein [Opitutaceae bacterium]|jgi:acyl carrier protein